MAIKHLEFAQLYPDAYREYLDTETGRKHLAAYAVQRQEAQRNLGDILAARARGEDITDAVLLKLLPYADTASTRAAGAWISITPTINGNLKHWFERAKWTAPADWPAIAGAILDLVQRCLADPSNLAAACETFAALPYSKGFQTGMLSPILNALNPDAFRILNNKSRSSYNYLAGMNHGQPLIDYPQSNATAIALCDALQDVIAAHPLPERIRPDDVLDAFSHWLVAIRKLDRIPIPPPEIEESPADYDPGSHRIGETPSTSAEQPTRYWKIAPGREAEHWEECRQNGYIALGWHEVRDISNMDRAAFDAHIEEIAQQQEGWTVRGMRQVWQLAHDIQIGDRVIANHGTKRIVGIGTVTGEYYHVPGESYPHRRPVRWDTVQPIEVHELGWIRTIIELNRAKFDALVAGDAGAMRSSATPATRVIAERGLAEPFSRVFADRDEALWAFEVMRESLDRLGVRGPEDERFRVSLLPASRGGLRLRLIFGNIVPIAFRGPADSPRHVEFSLLRAQGTAVGLQSVFDYKMPEPAPEISLYAVPRPEGAVALAELKDDYLATLDVFRSTHGHWHRATKRAFSQPEIQKALFDKALLERLLTEGLRAKDIEQSESYFSGETFALLEGLQETPTRAFYLNHKNAFVEHVEEPLQALFADVVAGLPEAVRDFVETEKNVFSRILKNDFGRGGAWTWYWGAMYKKGGRRIENAQLYISITPQELRFGVDIGDYDQSARQRYARNMVEHGAWLCSTLEGTLPEPIGVLEFGRESESVASMSEWAAGKAAFPRIVQHLDPDTVLSLDRAQLAEQICRFLATLFPIVLFTELDEPMAAAQKYVGEEPPVNLLQPDYPLAACAQATSLPLSDLDAWVQAIERKGQAVLYGPPGTGKTFVARLLAQHLVGGGDGFCELVQFHPSYAYEDFVQGIRPQRAEGGGLDYPVLPGRFVRFCSEAALRSGRCVLIIDEINRANLARVFGELMYLLEYRDDQVSLAVDGRRFRIPANVRILGTMNTADRSIALVDHALRRRFAFIRLDPQYDVLTSYHREHNPGFAPSGLISVLQRLNTLIADPHYAVGISFFLVPDVRRQIESIWRMEIEPYLEEYFFDSHDSASQFSWQRIRSEVLRS